MNFQAIPITSNDITKALAEIEKQRIDKENEIEQKQQEIEKAEDSYLIAKGRIDIKLLDINTGLAHLNNIGSRTKEQDAEKEDLENRKPALSIERNQLNLINRIDRDKQNIGDYTNSPRRTKEKLQND